MAAAQQDLQIDDIDVRRGGHQVLRSLSMSVHQGQIVALIGPNGAGKSSLLRTISGLHRLRRGKIDFKGKTLPRNPRDIVRAGIAHVPEGREVFPRLTVTENLEMGGFTTTKGLSRDYQSVVLGMFPQLALLQQRRAGLLSGGEQQMLAIARALMSQPTMLLLDEPSLGLAPRVVREVGHVVRQVHAAGKTILIAEQQLGLALDLADYVYVLVNGQVAEHGPAGRYQCNSSLAEVYLGVSVNTTRGERRPGERTR